MSQAQVNGFNAYGPDNVFVIKKSQLSPASPVKPENALHQSTVRMKEIKAQLNLTTRQFVLEINAFESTLSDEEREIDPDVTSSFAPFTPVMLSSYLQGRVLQEAFMSAILKRLELFYKFKMLNLNELHSLRRQYRNMAKVVEGWMLALNIDPTQGSPYRALAAKVNPFYKRAVFTAKQGKFVLGEKISPELQAYSIYTSDTEYEEYVLNPNEPILITDGQELSIGDVIQYSLPIKPGNKKYRVSQKMPLNQSTFFRWHTNNSPPKSAKIIEQINEAVKLAALEYSTQKGR